MALAEIVRHKRETIAARMRDRPTLAEASPSDRSFVAALRRKRTGFVLECKKASPSQGLIREDFDPAAIAASYAPFADAISVLTDARYFQGELAFLTQVRQAAPQPVLCKDFVVDPYQIQEARLHGADAILLMCSVLDQPTLERCLERTRALNMGALVEVHDAEELDRAIAVGAEVIGINNRNLETLEVDLAVTRELAPKVPAGTVSIAESGIRDHDDVVALRDQVDAFLVGTALMREADLDAAVRALIFGRTKICGLTAPLHAVGAHSAGATHGGLVLWPRSPRAVSLDDAHAVRRAALLSWVGVFVDEQPATVADLAEALELSAVQLHGNEDAAYVQKLRPALPAGCAIWKAHRVSGPGDAQAPEVGADRLLLDAFVRGVVGGTGTRFDWDLVKHHPARKSLVLSGGIAPDNVADADALGCWAIDLSSGVERRPGDKDLDLIEGLFAARRGPGRRASERRGS
jgi:indole-3-glycerol phosphate synthase / phosphoribosylanthranilate isomerase